MVERVAVVGASGFIGNRTVEVLHMHGVGVVPIARRPSGLALAGRFRLDGRVADALDSGAMAVALRGCDVALVAVAGDERTIVETVEPLYRAAQAAGIRRIVYLSTASVHGQAPSPGTDERSALSDRQPIGYNNAKVRAERELMRLRAAGSTEVVLLRPGIVYGPRSQWIGTLAEDLLAGDAMLVDGGHGVCNAIYVDNLVHAIGLAFDGEGADGEAFLVADAERVTWRDLYRPVADALGVDLDALPQPPPLGTSARSWKDLVPRAALRRCLPAPLRAGVRAAYTTYRTQQIGPTRGPAPRIPSLETSLLHTCSYKVPWIKARTLLGFEPPITFEEGCRHSVAWLEFAGYPTMPTAGKEVAES